MLDTLTPEQFGELEAADAVDPDPLERIAEILKMGFAATCLGKVKPDDFEPSREITFGDKAQPVISEVSPNQAAAIATCALGRPHNQGGAA